MPNRRQNKPISRYLRKVISPKIQYCESVAESQKVTIKNEITIPVYGMSCQKCVARVTAALQAIEGVIEVEVSLPEQLGRITVADLGPNRGQLLEAVVKAGFQVIAPIADDLSQSAGQIDKDDLLGGALRRPVFSPYAA